MYALSLVDSVDQARCGAGVRRLGRRYSTRFGKYACSILEGAMVGLLVGEGTCIGQRVRDSVTGAWIQGVAGTPRVPYVILSTATHMPFVDSGVGCVP